MKCPYKILIPTSTLFEKKKFFEKGSITRQLRGIVTHLHKEMWLEQQ